MPLCVHEDLNWLAFTVPLISLDIGGLLELLWMLKGMEDSPTKGKLQSVNYTIPWRSL
jgi:hypothetical protein